MGGLILAAGTDAGHPFPNDGAYTTAAVVGIVAMAVTTMACLARPPYVRPGRRPDRSLDRRGADASR